MRIEADLELDGLEQALAPFLPMDGAVQPKALRVNGTTLRLDAMAPMAGQVTLTARVQQRRGGMTLSDFDLEGAKLFKGVVLGMLRSRLAGLDVRREAFHAWGEADGERLQIRWSESD